MLATRFPRPQGSVAQSRVLRLVARRQATHEDGSPTAWGGQGPTPDRPKLFGVELGGRCHDVPRRNYGPRACTIEVTDDSHDAQRPPRNVQVAELDVRAP